MVTIMSNVTAALECPGCTELLAAEERPNTDWKRGTVRIVLVPTDTAIAHVFECTGIRSTFDVLLDDLGIDELDAWQKRLVLSTAGIEVQPTEEVAAPSDLNVTGETTIEGAEPDLVIIDEAIEIDEDPAKTEAIADPAASTEETTETTESTDSAETKPAPKRRTTK